MKLNFHLFFSLKTWVLMVIRVLPFFVMLNFAHGQGYIDCNSPDPSIEEYQKLDERTPRLYARLASAAPVIVNEIPLYFTVIRKEGGTLPSPYSSSIITTADIDNSIDYLNQSFSGTNLHFFRLGNVNFIDHDPSSYSKFWFEQYSNIPTAFNIYIGGGFTTGFTPQPSAPIIGPTYNNLSNIPYESYTNSSLKQWVVAHEFGHHFGLLHTFGAPQLYYWPINETYNGEIDHPYFGIFKRELAIDQIDNTKTFKLACVSTP